jgi:hypothetical protein
MDLALVHISSEVRINNIKELINAISRTLSPNYKGY